ncbi:MAG TPA: hypothetical protein VK184_10325 [Nostocaceae cyanobacterium]|nr:hypothetical protein [Nostocaceae cyanobacterium]
MSKKKLTICATPEGLQKAEQALKRLKDGKKESLVIALQGLVGKSTIIKFFKREPISVDKFREICQEPKYRTKIVEREEIHYDSSLNQ